MKKIMLSIFSILLTSAFLYGAVTITVDNKSNNLKQTNDNKNTKLKDAIKSNITTKTEQKKDKGKPQPAAPGFGTTGGI